MPRPFVLVAAFRPFGGRADNESEKALRAFLGRRSARAGLRLAILPVSWARAFPQLVPALDDPALAAVVLFGEAGKRRVVTVERWGRNRAAKILDMDGRKPASERLSPRGASRRRATWRPAEVLRALFRAGIRATESRDAGGFLCNATLYRTLDRLSYRGVRVPVAFVHLPIPRLGAAPGTTRARLARAVGAVVEEARRRFLPGVSVSPPRRARGPRPAPRRR